jgi:hypothetical protein
VEKRFAEYFGEAGSASVQDVAELYPELERALLQFLEAYVCDGAVSAAEFMTLHLDMYTSMPLKYKSVIEKREQ